MLSEYASAFALDTPTSSAPTSPGAYVTACLLYTSLKGKKIILKGNHDYWWESITKLTGYVEKNGFNSISFLHNSAVMVENKAICGTRGWIDKSNDLSLIHI